VREYRATITFTTPDPLPEEVLSELELRMAVQLEYLQDVGTPLESLHSTIKLVDSE
jgi:hypothetical protein